MAGNAFTGTVLQAKFLAAFVNSASLSSRGDSGKRKVAENEENWWPVKRQRSRTNLPPAPGDDEPATNSKRGLNKQKGKTLSIMQKVALIDEYQALVDDPTIKHAEKVMLAKHRHHGVYQGCFAQTKWPMARFKHEWDAVIEHAPKVAQKYAEVPNWWKRILNKATHKVGRLSTVFPREINHVLEAVIMERSAFGETVDPSVFKETTLDVVRTYNDEVDGLNEQIALVNRTLIRTAHLEYTQTFVIYCKQFYICGHSCFTRLIYI